MKVKTEKIEDITITVKINKGRKDILYFIPQGMDGKEFSAFKARNVIVINELKKLCDEREEESEQSESDNLFSQQGAQERLSHNHDIQECEYISGCDHID